MFAWVCSAKVTVTHHRQNSGDVNIQRIQLSSRCENHGWVPMFWWDFIFGFEWKTWKWQKDGPQLRFLPPGCANPDLHINKDFKKGHRGLLKTTVKLMDMLLHVCMSVCCKSHCQTPQTKQWWCQHSENSVEFQIWKSWESAYELMWFHLWMWVEDMEMTESVTNCAHTRPRVKTEKTKKP